MISTPAAFFDLDNTLVKGSSLFLIGRGLVARGLVRRRDIARYALVQVRFRLWGEHLGHLGRAQERALELGVGLSVADLVAAGGEVYDERVVKRLWVQTLALAHAHLAAGDEVWLVTAAPIEVATLIAGRLGLTGGLGTESEVVDGRWTGRLTSPILHGPAKAVAVRALAAERGLSLPDSHAYSDSINDRSLLEVVEHPHAVNPDRQLARLARQQDWPIHEHRADPYRAARTATAWARRRMALPH